MTMNLSPSSPHSGLRLSRLICQSPDPPHLFQAPPGRPTRTTAMNRVEGGERGGIQRAGGWGGAAFLFGGEREAKRVLE